MTEAPCRVEVYADDLAEQEALIEYNRYREKTFSQQMAEAEQLQEIEGSRAKERQEATRAAVGKKIGEHVKVVQNFAPPSEKGKARDKVAKKLGMSGFNYDKAAKVWKEAKKGNEAAQEQVKRLDEGRVTIHSAYKKATAKKQEKKPLPLPTGEFDVILADPP